MASRDELVSRIESLKNEGRTVSTSKKLAKLTDQLNRGDFGGSGSGRSEAANFGDYVSRARDMTMDAIKPAVDSLRSSISPLEERYYQLLGDIKGIGEQQVTQETLTQSRELGRRGILPSSGLFDSTVSDAVAPIRAETQRTLGDVGFQSEQAIQNVLNTIANLQAQAGLGAINTGSNLFNTAQQLTQQQSQFNAQNQLAQLAQQLNERRFNEVTLPIAQYGLNKPYYKPEDQTAPFFNIPGFNNFSGFPTNTNLTYTSEGDWVLDMMDK